MRLWSAVAKSKTELPLCNSGSKLPGFRVSGHLRITEASFLWKAVASHTHSMWVGPHRENRTTAI